MQLSCFYLIRMITKLNFNSDNLGIASSTLCFIHCIATPFLFLLHSSSHLTPTWWRFLDVVFLLISFFAIYFTIKNTDHKWVKVFLLSAWILLLLIILNEQFHVVEIVEEIIYVPSLVLIVVHYYNKKYCKCSSKEQK